MSQKTIGLIGRKVGMTQVFQPDGTMVAVSVVKISPNTVTRIRTTDRDGYTAVQIGAGERKKLTKPLAGEDGHGGGDLFQLDSQQMMTFLKWFM